jgi:hypothetical protein
MRSHYLLGALALLALIITSTTASALSYMYVPEQVRLMTAELVVVGKMNGVNQEGQKITGTLAITEVLKGKITGKTLKLAWADLSRFGGGRGHQNGQQGVWILSKGRDGKFATGYPGNFLQMNQIKRIKQTLTEIKKMKWGKANGLEMTCITETRISNNNPGQGKGPSSATVMIYPIVRNGSKQTLQLIDFAPDKPFVVTMTTPSGGKLHPDLYPRPLNMKLNARQFKPLEPGKLRMLGYGLKAPIITEAGEHKIVVSFQNKRDGKEFNLKGVWIGKIESVHLVTAKTK